MSAPRISPLPTVRLVFDADDQTGLLKNSRRAKTLIKQVQRWFWL
jgi:hypothetical protein